MFARKFIDHVETHAITCARNSCKGSSALTGVENYECLPRSRGKVRARSIETLGIGS